MIYGDGVMSKYQVIVDGYRAELYKGAKNPTVEQCEQKASQVRSFIQTIRQCNHHEFEEWYQLYR